MTSLASSRPRDAGKRSRLVERGFMVLFALAECPNGLTLGALTRRTGLSRATALRILRTLRDLEVVVLDAATGHYRLGPSAQRLGHAASQHPELLRTARPVLEKLQIDTGETACLFRAQHAERVCIAVVTSEQELKYSIDVGHRRPLLLGAPGKIIAAYTPPDELRQLVGRRADRALSPAERKRILAEGVASSSDEVVRGGTAVAAPVFGPGGRLVAVLAVIGPTARMDRTVVKHICGLTREAARALTAALGGAARRSEETDGGG